MIYNNNLIYQGSWIDNERAIYGTLKQENGNFIYKGEWKNDKFHGRG